MRSRQAQPMPAMPRPGAKPATIMLLWMLVVSPMSGQQSYAHVTTEATEASEQQGQLTTSGWQRSLWHNTINESTSKAEQLLTAAGIIRQKRTDRLFIPMLSFRQTWLCSMVSSYAANVAPNNPTDMFVFSPNNRAEEGFKTYCGDKASNNMTIHFMSLKEHWAVPTGSAADKSLWSPLNKNKPEYRIMGHWRLLFQYTLADKLGYKYLWQLDDDSEITLPVETRLVTWMKENQVLMAYRRAYSDKVAVTWGLPELTRTFLVAERYNPVGTLLVEHTTPPGIDGLYTTKDLSSPGFTTSEAVGGWDRKILYGNCVLVDVEFWFQPLVQRYIELVTASWYHYRFRWNEQSTMGMIWQMFVPKQQSKLLPIPAKGYKHKNKLYDATIPSNT